jgi:hypothetical protein
MHLRKFILNAVATFRRISPINLTVTCECNEETIEKAQKEFGEELIKENPTSWV